MELIKRQSFEVLKEIEVCMEVIKRRSSIATVAIHQLEGNK